MFGWDSAEQQAFLRMQFDMKARAYAMQYPRAEHSIIVQGGKAAGRLIVDRDAARMSLTDIAVMPEFRGKAIATTIIKRLQQEAIRTGRPIDLNVDKANPLAFQLYRKLGFDIVSETDLDLQMRWTPKRKK
jgi:ribosomal protein S18 acetylase RimI-like enzyme